MDKYYEHKKAVKTINGKQPNNDTSMHSWLIDENKTKEIGSNMSAVALQQHIQSLTGSHYNIHSVTNYDNLSFLFISYI